MDKKVATISGGAKNIGKGIALKLLSENWRVAIIDIDKNGLQNLEGSEDILKFCGDVSSEKDVKEFFEKIKEKFGRLDLIVNNAAIGGFKNFLDLSVSEWKKVIDVNLTGYFLMSRFGVPLILENPGKGTIVNIASTRSIMSEPGNEAYSASKSGILGLTHALANSLGPNIRVNAISPGWILHENETISEEEHKQHPVGRAGKISDIAELVLFLSDENKSGFITGANIVIDGGMTRKMIYI